MTSRALSTRSFAAGRDMVISGHLDLANAAAYLYDEFYRG